MFDLDRWQEVFATLRTNKLRTAMTACGVFWGVFMLVLMLGFGNGLQQGVAQKMFGFVSNAVYVWGGRTSIPYRGLAERRRVRYTNADTEAIRSIEGIDALAPRIQLGGWRDGNNMTHGAKTGNFAVMGDYPDLAKIDGILPSEGRFLNDLDLAERRKTAVIGEQVRKVLFDEGEPALGQYIKIRGIHFRVVGVFTSPQPGEQGDRANSTVHIPFTTFQRAFNAYDQVGWFALGAAPNVDATVIERKVKRVLFSRHAVHPDDEQAIGSFNAAEKFGHVQRLFLGIRFFIWFVSLATLAAGALGVSNIMLISVKERTKEIGVRKALGATPASIVTLVMQEAALLTVLSGYVGLVFGVLMLELAGKALTRLDAPLSSPSIDLTTALWSAGLLAVIGVIAGIAPAGRAASIRPVVALRSE